MPVNHQTNRVKPAALSPQARAGHSPQTAAQVHPAAQQHAVNQPGQAGPQAILSLQRSVGNRAVTKLIQAKLQVGPVGDTYEQEADKVAEQVVNNPAAVAMSQASQGVQREEEIPSATSDASPMEQGFSG